MMKKTSGQEGEAGDSPGGRRLGASDEREPARRAPPPPRQLLLSGISVLDKLIGTCPVWLQLNIKKEKVLEILHAESLGTFIVRKDSSLENMVLSVNFSELNGTPNVQDYSIKEAETIMHLEGSLLVFEDIFKMVAFYCVSRDVLPTTLALPHAIAGATNSEELDIVSHLGIEFWNSDVNRRFREGSSSIAKGLNATDGHTRNQTSNPCLSTDNRQCSCEIELSVGNDKLWFVNPVFIKEYTCAAPTFSPPSSPPSFPPCDQSSNFKINMGLKSKRAPPLPPRPRPTEMLLALSGGCKGDKGDVNGEGPRLSGGEIRVPKSEVRSAETNEEQDRGGKEVESNTDAGRTQSYFRLPPIPPRRRLSEKQYIEAGDGKTEAQSKEVTAISEEEICSAKNAENSLQSENNSGSPLMEDLIDLTVDRQSEPYVGELSPIPEGPDSPSGLEQKKNSVGQAVPVAPPRRKKMSRQVGWDWQKTQGECTAAGQEIKESDEETTGKLNDQVPDTFNSSARGLTGSSPPIGSECVETSDRANLQLSDGSLYSTENNQQMTPVSEPDSYSTSSTEEELETVTSPSHPKNKRHSIILDKAKNRLSIVTLSNVFNAFRSSDHKIQKRIAELAQEKESYFGHLVQDYRTYTLETMGNQTSSTELLQEIRQMMTQLKSYLLQSTELKSVLDQFYHSEEKLEALVEAALCKCVLKPLKEQINSQLKEIHSRNGTLKLLKENQQIVQNTTTTELGVTTCVPEVTLLEKIQQKFLAMHQAYSPDKKVTYLLKFCKLIYDSMSTGNPGKVHGADDFLPVLMYVLARSNLTSLFLDVEYMMELLDPSLHLGEGYYYLTTTYGALHHIKHFDKQAATRQLSHEVQDSIHEWQRRRTLNMKQMSRVSVQDFLSVSFPEVGSNMKTFAIKPESTAEELCVQCAEKFGVTDPEDHHLFVLVDEKYLQLAAEAVPHNLKSVLQRSQPRKDYHFLYKQISHTEEDTNPPIKELPCD